MTSTSMPFNDGQLDQSFDLGDDEESDNEETIEQDNQSFDYNDDVETIEVGKLIHKEYERHDQGFKHIDDEETIEVSKLIQKADLSRKKKSKYVPIHNERHDQSFDHSENEDLILVSKRSEIDQKKNHRETMRFTKTVKNEQHDQSFDHMENKKTIEKSKLTHKDWKIISREYFPTHNKVMETHLFKVYGTKSLSLSVSKKENLLKEISDLKIQVVKEIKNRLKLRLVKAANEQNLQYYTKDRKQFFVRIYHDIKKSFATDIRRENLKKIFHVCYAQFDLEKDWILSMEHDILMHFKLKYSSEEDMTRYESKIGRPSTTSLGKIISIAKNDLVKGIIYHGSKIHGIELRVKHTVKRTPGIFQDDFIVKKNQLLFTDNNEVVINDDCIKINTQLDKEDIGDANCYDTTKDIVEGKTCDKNIVQTTSMLKLEISKLRKKILNLEKDNNQMKRELSYTAKMLVPNKKKCSLTAKEMQAEMKNTMKNLKPEENKNMSPTYSYLSINTGDDTKVQNWKQKCKLNRKRNARFEAEFLKQKREIILTKTTKKCKRKNQYTECPTISPISFDSSRITIDTGFKKKIVSPRKTLLPKRSIVNISVNADDNGEDILKEVSCRNKYSTKKQLNKHSVPQREKKSVGKKSSSLNCIKKNKQTEENTVDKKQEETLKAIDDKEYVLESIIGHTKKNGRYMFEVKWKDCPKTSWETKHFLDSFVCDDVNTYLEHVKSTEKKETKKQRIDDAPDEGSLYSYPQPLDCVHDAICLRIENNSSYCTKGNILFNARCAECDKVFHKLSDQNSAHLCKNIGRGCNYALCQECFTNKLLHEVRPGRRRHTTISITL